MVLKAVETSGANCGCSAALASTSIGSNADDFKTQVLIVECAISGVLLVLMGCVVYLFYWGRKLAKLVKALDPVGTYKRVGPSIYLKKPQRDNASISSSFQHFSGRPEEAYTDEDTINANRTKDLGGTLDRNFFTSTNFSFQNSFKEKTKSPVNFERSTTEDDVMEAITKIDNALY